MGVLAIVLQSECRLAAYQSLASPPTSDPGVKSNTPVSVAGCSAGEFDAVPTSAKLLRMLRNPEHPLRIPGQGIIANTSSEVVTASVKAPHPHTRHRPGAQGAHTC